MIQPYVTLTERGVLGVTITGDVNIPVFEGRRSIYDPAKVWPQDGPAKPDGWDDAVNEAIAECEAIMERDPEAIAGASYGRKFA